MAMQVTVEESSARSRQGSYTARDMTVLEGLDPVRKRPGMYIGSTGPTGLHHLVWEVVDNSVDEAMAGYCSRIDVTLTADGGCRVVDDGRGIPTDINPQQKISGVEIALTKLHGGDLHRNRRHHHRRIGGARASFRGSACRWTVITSASGALLNVQGFSDQAQDGCYASKGTSYLCTLQTRPLGNYTNTSAANNCTTWAAQWENASVLETYGPDVGGELRRRLARPPSTPSACSPPAAALSARTARHAHL